MTQHVLQQLSTDHGGGESGHTNYAKLQKDEVITTKLLKPACLNFSILLIK